ncbi:transcription termination/antitermination NusG family protein, partial [Arthrospira platensis SPKY1]|nr:transcription termination/antitermination NusG family protein [Arthrospira platensis SPKY1]
MSQGAISKEAKWMAVYTKPRCEKKAFERLSKREDLELYLPVQKRLKQWSDRKKWVEEVVLPSYLFIKCTEKQRYDIL